jgi:hypothetical protein
LFLVIRLLLHAINPRSSETAGNYHVFNGLVAGVLYPFGFIAAAALGCTVGSCDIAEGMFRQLVVTGRSRLAIYLARIPAGLGIILPLMAVSFGVVCYVCVFTAPAKFNFQGVNVPLGLSPAGYENWAADHPSTVMCDFPFSGPCNVGQEPNTPMTKAQAIRGARQDYPSYAETFLSPPATLMVKTGLWLELEATVGLIIGLGLAALMGQRMLPMVLILLSELLVWPILLVLPLPINLQRSLPDFAMAHLEPNGLGFAGGLLVGGPGATRSPASLVPESIIVAICVIAAWLLGWTAIGAWRAVTRDG